MSDYEIKTCNSYPISATFANVNFLIKWLIEAQGMSSNHTTKTLKVTDCLTTTIPYR